MSNKNQNPFADLFSGFTKNLPSIEAFDWNQAVSVGRLNAKALSDAAKAAAEGVQAMSQLQAKIVQKNAEEFSQFFKDISSTDAVKNPEASVAKQAKFAQESINSALDGAKELSEIATKSNNEANEIISKRISSALSEAAANANTGKKKKSEAA